MTLTYVHVCTRTPLPAMDATKDKTNILDQRRYDTRVACMNTIVEEATKLRENATDVNEALEEIQGYLHILQDLAVEVIIFYVTRGGFHTE